MTVIKSFDTTNMTLHGEFGIVPKPWNSLRWVFMTSATEPISLRSTTQSYKNDRQRYLILHTCEESTETARALFLSPTLFTCRSMRVHRCGVLRSGSGCWRFA